MLVEHLWEIRDLAREICTLVAGMLQTDVEIADADLRVVATTGSNSGVIVDSELYRRCIRNRSPGLAGAEQTRVAACPVLMDAEAVGLIGVVCHEAERGRAVLSTSEWVTELLGRMSTLITARLGERVREKSVRPAADLHPIFDAAACGLIVFNMEGIVSLCNRAAMEILRLDVDPVGQPIGRCYLPLRDVDAIVDFPPTPEEEVLFESDGYTFRLVQSLRPLTEGGRRTGTVVTLRKGAVTGLSVEPGPGFSHAGFDRIIGQSRAIRAAKSVAARVACTDATVLLLGESGTGKELLACAIHEASRRRHGPLVTVNCGAIPDALLESELFGYVGGAFTGALRGGKPGKFELASGGTLFLDEVGDLPLPLQVKLLRAVDRGTIERVGATRSLNLDVRIVAATNRNLKEMVSLGEFREDLYYRLAVIPLHLPPLRERPDDVLLLVDFYAKRLLGERGQPGALLSAEALRAFQRYSWPGNVRELQNALSYAAAMCDGSTIGIEHVPAHVIHPSAPERELPTLDEAERSVIMEALKVYGTSFNGKRRAADALGINISTLYRKIKQVAVHLQ